MITTKAKKIKDKIDIKQFKDNSSHWWVNDAHYSLNVSGELIWHAGEVDKEELRNSLLSFIRRNKKVYKERSPSIFDSEPKQYNEKINFGKHINKTVSEVFSEDVKYLSWMLKNYNFSAKENLKREITEILKK